MNYISNPLTLKHKLVTAVRIKSTKYCGCAQTNKACISIAEFSRSVTCHSDMFISNNYSEWMYKYTWCTVL